MVEPKLNDTDAGEPEGPDTLGLVDAEPPAVVVDVAELNFNPNGELAESSETENDVVVAGAVPVVLGLEITSRPRPVVPSATARSAINCFNPARLPLPLRMASEEATAGALIALPEKI